MKIGDYITLRSAQFSAYLAAEGILLQDLTVNNELSFFDDYIFAIHLQRQYSAARELEDFLEKNQTDIENKHKNTMKILNALTVI